MKLLHVPSRKEIANAIRRARLRKGLSQDKLAELVGADGGRHTVIPWETGKSVPTVYRERVAAVLEIPIAEVTLDGPELDLRVLTERLDAVRDEERELREMLQDALARQGNDGSAPE